MIVLDRLLVSGLCFVLDQIATAADAQLDDEGNLKEELLAAQLQVELGEMSEERFAAVEGEIMARLRRLREDRGEAHGGISFGEQRVEVDVFSDVGEE